MLSTVNVTRDKDSIVIPEVDSVVIGKVSFFGAAAAATAFAFFDQVGC
jgi:hypothetical protein